MAPSWRRRGRTVLNWWLPRSLHLCGTKKRCRSVCEGQDCLLLIINEPFIELGENLPWRSGHHHNMSLRGVASFQSSTFPRLWENHPPHQWFQRLPKEETHQWCQLLRLWAQFQPTCDPTYTHEWRCFFLFQKNYAIKNSYPHICKSWNSIFQ